MSNVIFVWSSDAYMYKNVSIVGTYSSLGCIGDIGIKPRIQNKTIGSIGTMGLDDALWGIGQVSSTGKYEYTASAIGGYYIGDVLSITPS